jgi:hypothetical protein
MKMKWYLSDNKANVSQPKSIVVCSVWVDALCMTLWFSYAKDKGLQELSHSKNGQSKHKIFSLFSFSSSSSSYESSCLIHSRRLVVCMINTIFFHHATTHKKLFQSLSLAHKNRIAICTFYLSRKRTTPEAD